MTDNGGAIENGGAITTDGGDHATLPAPAEQPRDYMCTIRYIQTLPAILGGICAIFMYMIVTSIGAVEPTWYFLKGFNHNVVMPFGLWGLGHIDFMNGLAARLPNLYRAGIVAVAVVVGVVLGFVPYVGMLPIFSIMALICDGLTQKVAQKMRGAERAKKEALLMLKAGPLFNAAMILSSFVMIGYPEVESGAGSMVAGVYLSAAMTMVEVFVMEVYGINLQKTLKESPEFAVVNCRNVSFLIWPILATMDAYRMMTLVSGMFSDPTSLGWTWSVAFTYVLQVFNRLGWKHFVLFKFSGKPSHLPNFVTLCSQDARFTCTLPKYALAVVIPSWRLIMAQLYPDRSVGEMYVNMGVVIVIVASMVMSLIEDLTVYLGDKMGLSAKLAKKAVDVYDQMDFDFQKKIYQTNGTHELELIPQKYPMDPQFILWVLVQILFFMSYYALMLNISMTTALGFAEVPEIAATPVLYFPPGWQA